MMDDLLVAFGDAVKFLDDAETRVGGYLVRFTTDKDPDLTGEFFKSDTDFGRDDIEGLEMPLHYEHGMDPDIGKARIGNGRVEKRDAGLWYEAQVAISDEYREYLRQLVRDGRLGYSSGAVAHLVDKREHGKAYAITRWPLGEASLTPRPAEPRNIVSLKSLLETKTLDGNADSEPEAEPQAAPDTAAATAATDPVVPADTHPAEMPDTKNADPQPIMENENQVTTGTPAFTEADIDARVKAAVEAVMNEQRTVKAAAPAIITLGRGDTGRKAMDHWLRTGDTGAVKSVLSGPNMIDIDLRAYKASNANDMTIGDATYAGNTVTDDMARQIVARRDESMLASALGVRRFTGTGTTLDVPTDSEADGEFVSTNEASSFDLDAPTVGQTVLTLVKYTKKILMSYELIQDTNTNLLEWVGDFVGRGLAKTHNDLLVNEVQANGGELELLGTSTLALGDLENAAFGNDIAVYLDDSGSVGWVMKPATYAAILAIGGTSNRYYSVDTGLGSVAQRSRPTILGMPVYFSQKVDAYGNGQPILFGNWNYMGLYESPTLQVLRDPFSVASTGQVAFHYYFRADYGVLQSEALGYLRHINT